MALAGRLMTDPWRYGRWKLGGASSSKFDLTLEVQEAGAGLSCRLEYATDLFDRSTMERFARHWLRILAGLAASPQEPVSQLSLLDDAEREELLGWHGAQVALPALAGGLAELVSAQAQRTPDAVAVRAGETVLSYAELEARSNRLAHRLLALGAGTGTVVGLCLERSAELVVAMLAILKSGSAFVPVDPAIRRTAPLHAVGLRARRLVVTQP